MAELDREVRKDRELKDRELVESVKSDAIRGLDAIKESDTITGLDAIKEPDAIEAPDTIDTIGESDALDGIELDVKIEAGDLYDYLLMHTYHSPSGLLGSGVGAVALLVGMARGQVIFVVAGIVLLFYLPWTLFLKSRQQAINNPAFRAPLHYKLDDAGITISQNDVEQHQEWAHMVKAVSTGHSIIVYTSKVNATIFPKRALGDKKTDVIEMISTHMPPGKVNIRN